MALITFFGWATPSSTAIIQFPAVNDSLTSDDLNAVDTKLYWDTYLWALTNVILLICILGGNALTLIAVRLCRRLRSLISNLFICSLAVSDFIVGLSLPYHLAFYLGSNWSHVYALCLIRFYLIIFACCVSILTLISISIDRYIAIVYPLHYRRYMTRRVAVLIIISTWFAGATVAAVPMFWNNWKGAFQCEFDKILPPWYMAGIITPTFIVIWMLMFLIYWRIIKEASKQAIQLKNLRKGQSNNTQPDWRSVQVVIFIMGCFSLCWLPYFIVACAQIFQFYNITPLLYKATFSLAMTNSALNPIIYAWKNSNFRKAFVRLLHCKTPNYYQTTLDNSKIQMSQICCHRKVISIKNKKLPTVSDNNIPTRRELSAEGRAGNDRTLQTKTQSLPNIYKISI